MDVDSSGMTSSDSGGVGAKRGFRYQDYVAAQCVIQMLRDKRLKAVRCEVTDDIDLVYDNYTEYIQVKTTDDESKWSISELCQVSKKEKENGKGFEKNSDSIVHKSLACDVNSKVVAKFRIISPRDVRAPLAYLKIHRTKRAEKDGREKILKSLQSQIGDFKSKVGNGIEYWIDNVEWEIISSTREIELECHLALLQSAALQNIILNSNYDPQTLLNSIIVQILEKSAISKKFYTAADKTYFRNDFVVWFDEEILRLAKAGGLHSKVYLSAESRRPVLLKFMDLDGGTQCGMGVEQQYHRRKYRFDYIADSLKDWIPEILLRPSELADVSGEKLFASLDVLRHRFLSQTDEFEKFLGKALLHSCIRSFSKSQPIPATLYIDANGSSFKQFDNIHIVPNLLGPDELWMGFSRIAPLDNIDSAMEDICIELDELLSDSFHLQRKKILDVKEDGYLIKHDVDEILDPSASLDDNIGRFKFVIFLGYASEHLVCELPVNSLALDRLELQKKEAQLKFELMLKNLSAKDEYFDSLMFFIYLFPIPCINTLMKTVEEKFKENLRAR